MDSVIQPHFLLFVSSLFLIKAFLAQVPLKAKILLQISTVTTHIVQAYSAAMNTHVVRISSLLIKDISLLFQIVSNAISIPFALEGHFPKARVISLLQSRSWESNIWPVSQIYPGNASSVATAV